MIEIIVAEGISIWTATAISLLALTGCLVARSLYDLFLHPLRNFPGPKRAAIGSLYEFYYDVVKDGTYIWQIEKMHREYGMKANHYGCSASS